MEALIYFAVIFAFLAWIGELKKIELLIFFSKPLVMLFTIIWIIVIADGQTILVDGFKNHLIWFILGLVFCLIGDVLFLLPDRFSKTGVILYLFGQISYILGFGRIIPPPGTLIPGLILAVLVIVVSARVFMALASRSGTSLTKWLNYFLTTYTVLISIMVYSALLTLLRKEWNYLSALMVSLGAILFYISEVLKAWDRFIETHPTGRLKVLASYHLAQISFAVGATLHFSLYLNS